MLIAEGRQLVEEMRRDTIRIHWCRSALLWVIATLAWGRLGFSEQVRTEIPYRDGNVILVSDFQERLTKTRYHAKGHVTITFQDILISSEEAEYDEENREGFTTGQTHFSQKQQWLTCSRAEFNLDTQTGIFYDASGYTDGQFSVSGRTIRKTGPDTYRVYEGVVTTCPEKQPKWSFRASRSDIRVDHTARLHKAVFKVKGIPVVFIPYVIVPLERKTRSSGFIPFRTGTSTTKGRVFSEGYYQTLGQSADMLIYGDYFTLRGLAIGGVLRIRPNSTTYFNIDAYGLHDNLDQGGVRLIVDGESRLKSGWRAVARVNITSNFTFRQAFADSFRAATVSQERANAFLTRNLGSFSTNIAFQREEVLFPIHSLVIRKVPSLEFVSLGTPLGRSPFIFGLRSSLDGMSRIDGTMETPSLVQRLDFYPRLALRLPSLVGFSFAPSVGVRETYYGARLSTSSSSGIANEGLHRRYADVNIDLRLPILEKDFSSSWVGKFRHALEPFATYRWIHGIKELRETIRFDEEDAIADTNEVEYGIVNRFYKDRKTGAGSKEKYEFMALGFIQKYYFDPTFGGAFQPGQINTFRPLDTVTGFYQTGIERNLSPISAFLRFGPQNGMYHELRADFDTKHRRWRNTGVSSQWQQGKISVEGTYFRTLALEPGGLPSSNQLQGQIRYGSPSGGFSTSFAVSHNFLTAELLSTSTSLNYVWNCCSVSTIFTQFNLGVRTESSFNFSFTLKGIGSFGNIKRPDGLF